MSSVTTEAREQHKTLTTKEQQTETRKVHTLFIYIYIYEKQKKTHEKENPTNDIQDDENSVRSKHQK